MTTDPGVSDLVRTGCTSFGRTLLSGLWWSTGRYPTQAGLLAMPLDLRNVLRGWTRLRRS